MSSAKEPLMSRLAWLKPKVAEVLWNVIIDLVARGGVADRSQLSRFGTHPSHAGTASPARVGARS